jgi:hypothetical protein
MLLGLNRKLSFRVEPWGDRPTFAHQNTTPTTGLVVGVGRIMGLIRLIYLRETLAPYFLCCYPRLSLTGVALLHRKLSYLFKGVYFMGAIAFALKMTSAPMSYGDRLPTLPHALPPSQYCGSSFCGDRLFAAIGFSLVTG